MINPVMKFLRNFASFAIFSSMFLALHATALTDNQIKECAKDDLVKAINVNDNQSAVRLNESSVVKLLPWTSSETESGAGADDLKKIATMRGKIRSATNCAEASRISASLFMDRIGAINKKIDGGEKLSLYETSLLALLMPPEKVTIELTNSMRKQLNLLGAENVANGLQHKHHFIRAQIHVLFAVLDQRPGVQIDVERVFDGRFKPGMTADELEFAFLTDSKRVLAARMSEAIVVSSSSGECVGDIGPIPDGLTEIVDDDLRTSALKALCKGKVFVVKKPITVYRVYDGSKAYTLYGRSGWQFLEPSGPRDRYQRNHSICPEWSPLDRVASCTLKQGAKVVIGTTKAEQCARSSDSTVATSALQVMVFNDSRNGVYDVENCSDGTAWP